MKKFWLALVTAVACAMLVFGACHTSNGLFIGCVRNQTATSISMSYRKFNGSEKYQIKYKEGDAIAIESTTESGKLRLTITKKGADESIYTGLLSEFPKSTVNVKEDGTYILLFQAEDHHGSFSLSWGE